MMKKLLLPLFFAAFLHHSAIAEEISNSNEITYDFLVRNSQDTGYGDHIPYFRDIFEKITVKTLLEFGLGYSTKYYLDHCNKVISVEFITSGYGPTWMKKCIDLYRGYSNWVPIAYFSDYKGDMSWAPYKYIGSDGIAKASSHQSRTYQSYSTIDNFYLNELTTFVKNLTKYNKVDVALVDPGNYIRGELVQMLFDKSPIILANHVNFSFLRLKDDIYGYSRIITPDDYEEIHLQEGMGTIIWIKKNPELQELIDYFKNQAAAIKKARRGN